MPQVNPRKWERRSEKYFNSTKGCGLSFAHRQPSRKKADPEGQEENISLFHATRKKQNPHPQPPSIANETKVHQPAKIPVSSWSWSWSWSTGPLKEALTVVVPSLLPRAREDPQPASLCPLPPTAAQGEHLARACRVRVGSMFPSYPLASLELKGQPRLPSPDVLVVQSDPGHLMSRDSIRDNFRAHHHRTTHNRNGCYEGLNLPNSHVEAPTPGTAAWGLFGHRVLKEVTKLI